MGAFSCMVQESVFRSGYFAMSLLALIHQNPFYELAALLILAAVVGAIGQLLRQPLIVSFIAVGVLVGPSGLALVQSHAQIEVLSELGIAILLFLVGLKLDLQLIKTLGVVSLTTGLGQVLFTSLIGFFIAIALGMDAITATYVAVALTFSSTIIIVKLLSDKREVDSLHGRIALGFLIVQDLVVVLAMMVLSALGIGGGAQGNVFGEIVLVLTYGAVLLVGVGLFMRYLATPLLSQLAHSPELLTIFAIAWAAVLAALGSYFGLSKELGGLLAGVSLASTPFREAIVGRLASLRDFLLLFFFIALGSQIDLQLLGNQVGAALIFSAFVLIGNPLIVMIIMGAMGYRKRTGFLAGLTVAQISEFSLIFMAMGLALGHVNADALGLVTLVGLITIALSVYLITYSHPIYRFLEPVLWPFERRQPLRELDDVPHGHEDSRCNVVLFGVGRYGSAIADYLTAAGYCVMAVDFNPDEVQRWRERGYDARYGDASDPTFVSHLPLTQVKWVISAMPQHDVGVTHEDPRLVLIDSLKKQGFNGKIAVSTQFEADRDLLHERGADLVFMPFNDAAERAVERLCLASAPPIDLPPPP